MLKSLKENFAPFLFATIVIGLFAFPFWSHFVQEEKIKTQDQRVDNIRVNGGGDILVGASTFFAQQASIQLNFEALGTYASVSGNLSFSGEIMPDGSTCGTNEILKRTGANNWDCATDSSGVASNSLNFDEFQNPLVLDANITVSSAGFNWNWDGTDFNDFGGASISGDLWLVKGQKIFGDTSDTHLELNSSTGTHVGYGSGANHTHMTITGNLFQFLTDNGTERFSVGQGGASTSYNFEAVGYASASRFLGNKASHSFEGTIEGLTNLGLSFGTTAKKIKNIVVNVLRPITTFVLPINGTLTEEGSIAGKTASASSGAYIGFDDGTNDKAIHDPCFGFYVEAPTSSNQKWVWHKKFNDPFTITSISPVASGTNAAGWNLYYGAAGSLTTPVFTLDKSASTASNPIYTSFANSAIGDSNVMDLVVSSTSAVLKSFTVNVCGYYPR